MKIDRAFNWLLYKGTEKPECVKTIARWRAMVKHIMREEKFSDTRKAMLDKDLR